MAEHHSESLYMKIFYYLLVLTILEILVALPTYPALVKGILLVGMALGKAPLVAVGGGLPGAARECGPGLSCGL